jgi:hypothetical protein
VVNHGFFKGYKTIWFGLKKYFWQKEDLILKAVSTIISISFIVSTFQYVTKNFILIFLNTVVVPRNMFKWSREASKLELRQMQTLWEIIFRKNYYFFIFCRDVYFLQFCTPNNGS